MTRPTAGFTQAELQRLIRAARAEGWQEVRIATAAGEVVLRSGTPAPVDAGQANDFDWGAFDRGEL